MSNIFNTCQKIFILIKYAPNYYLNIYKYKIYPFSIIGDFISNSVK